ncbi:MAG: hypothetical protein K2J80_08120 [Oscillospiraceae bacterium]|nr:hypothetical protein [Oscillospiraceae bacterium]
MGRFSTTVHIKNDVDRMRFVNTFIDVMKKRGFVPCAEDEAAQSYLFAFGDGWVTLANEEYKDNPKKTYHDIQELAARLKTSVFSVEVVDSDFAIMTLHAPSGRTSRIVVGDGEGYGVEKAPFSADDWKPLLQNGDVEKFLAVIGQDSTFVEDDLAEIGGLLGISNFAMTADYDELSENEGAFELSFKKAAEKKLTLNAAFKQVFGEALEPLGYQLIKGKYPYFVRVVSNEIIHVISYYNDKKCYDRDHDYIQIKGGVATVYRPEIDLTQNPKWENWLTTNCSIYIYRIEHNLEERDDELKRQIYNHPSLPNESLKAMEYQLALTKRFILPALDKAMTIDSCIENDFEIRMSLTIYDDGSFGTTEGNGYFDEGMLYFKTDRSVYENITRNAVNEGALRRRAYFEKVHNDPDLYSEVQAELERRKAANIEILRSYGIDI